jgi:hypothetical protein
MSRHVWKSQGRTLSRTYQRTDLLQGIHLAASLPLFVGVVTLSTQTLAFMESVPSLQFSLPWALFGGACFFSGLVGMMIQKGRVLDGDTRTLTDWWGLIRPVWRDVVSLARAGAVEITRESRVHKGRHGPRQVEEVYEVHLRVSNRRILVDRFADNPEEARWTAEGVSRLLGSDFRDKTVSPPVLKKSSELDESLGQSCLRTGRPLPKPHRPSACRLRCLESPDGLEVRIPRANLANPWRPVGAALGMALFLMLLSVFVWQESWGFSVPTALVVGGLMEARATWSSWQARRLTETLRLTRQALRVESTLYGNHEIPLRELEELVLRDFREHKAQREVQVERFFPVGVLCARSDRGQACFGGALGLEELQYLQALLVERIVEFSRPV